MKRLILITWLLLPVAHAEEGTSNVPVLDPEQLESYQFENRAEESLVTIKELSTGQHYTLDSDRQAMKELATRRLGILSFHQNKKDLEVIQKLIDRKAIGQDDVRAWQSLGVVFGDVLAQELNMHWVSYEDELGVSKALQWKKTENYVFPVTMFSKRVKFKDEIDVIMLFERMKLDVESFKRYEAIHGRIQKS
mgnify:CR=1 FL=1|jgi:hypothetical protein